MISIIIPTYNRAPCLEKTVSSILKQEFIDFEIIIVDDGSTDNTLDIIETKFSDKRIKCISINNSGVSAARNVGVNLSSFKYLIFLDSDDSVGSSWLKDFKLKLEESDYDLVFCGYSIFRYMDFKKIILSNNFADKIKIAGTFLVKKDMFLKCGGYDENLKFGENTEMGIRYMTQNPSVGHVKNINVEYYWTPTGHSKNILNQIHSILYNIKKHKKLYQKNKLSKAYSSVAVNYMRLNKIQDSRFYLIKSIIMNPFNIKSIFRICIIHIPILFKKYKKRINNYRLI